MGPARSRVSPVPPPSAASIPPAPITTTGTVAGDSNNYTYANITSIDPNKHVSISFNDALGRSVYQQFDSGLYGGTLTLNEQKTIQYNVLNEPTSVKVDEKAPQTGQSITSVTTTAQYDDLGRLTQVVDPDRGTHTYTLDANGNVVTDVSGSRTIGYNYDLLGRVGCVQDNTPTINATGACSAGNIYVQNTYAHATSLTVWASPLPKGQLTQSLSNTYLTGPGWRYRHHHRIIRTRRPGSVASRTDAIWHPPE